MSWTTTSAAGGRMLGYLPPFYRGSRVAAIMDAIGHEIDAWRRALAEIPDNVRPSRATWWLPEWERLLGLPPAPHLTLAQRRERLVSRLRGVGTPTIRALLAVAAAYENGIIEVAEDYAGYRVFVRFADTRGVPGNLADLQAVIREVVPAHLDIVWVFTWFVWDALDAKGWTWDDLDALAVTWDKLEVMA